MTNFEKMIHFLGSKKWKSLLIERMGGMFVKIPKKKHSARQMYFDNWEKFEKMSQKEMRYILEITPRYLKALRAELKRTAAALLASKVP